MSDCCSRRLPCGGVPASDLVAQDSVITHQATGRQTTYGAMAARAAEIQLPDPWRITIKAADEFTLMGTSGRISARL